MNKEGSSAPSEIRTLSEFTVWINSLTTKEDTQKQAFFYRGHANKDYELQPTAYRMNEKGESYRLNESRIYHEMLRRDPISFAPDSTIFEHLVHMQHYGLPTRLLDLTQSPLVALFFACKSEPNKDGSVNFFQLGQQEVLHQQTLPNTSLAGVDKPLDFSELGQQLYNSIKGFFERERTVSNEDENLNKDLVAFLSDSVALFHKADREEKFHDVMKYAPFIGRFLDTILENQSLRKMEVANSITDYNTEKNFFESILNFEKRLRKWETDRITEICDQIGIPKGKHLKLSDFLLQLTHFYFVFPPMNNERIRRQQGAFLIFPPCKTEFWKIKHWKKPVTAIIQACAKKNLLKELKNQGIYSSYLFPELDEQAKDICQLYPPC